MEIDTRLVHFDRCPNDPYGPNSTPIYQTSTFAQTSATEFGSYDYTRSGNPTRRVLEDQLAQLEGGAKAFAFTSGMAALSAVLRLVSPGDRVLAGEDLYGGTFRLLDEEVQRIGVTVDYVDTSDEDAVAQALESPTQLLLVETPTNPLQRICDLRAVARIANARGTLLCVDNTMLSPYLQRPIEFGADLVVHSATKHLGGHSDVTAGCVVCASDEVARRIGFVQNAEGNGLAPFDSWLLLRGLKTLGLRVERAQDNAYQIARFLETHPLVSRVHYPGLETHPGYELQREQASGDGCLIAFETGSFERSRAIVECTELFTISVSFGSVGSSISLPCRMSHASIPEEERDARALPEDLVRISVGIENARDLLQDLASALETASTREDETRTGVLEQIALMP